MLELCHGEKWSDLFQSMFVHNGLMTVLDLIGCLNKWIGGYKIQARDEQVLVPRHVYLIRCLCAAYLIATVARRL